MLCTVVTGIWLFSNHENNWFHVSFLTLFTEKYCFLFFLKMYGWRQQFYVESPVFCHPVATHILSRDLGCVRLKWVTKQKCTIGTVQADTQSFLVSIASTDVLVLSSLPAHQHFKITCFCLVRSLWDISLEFLSNISSSIQRQKDTASWRKQVFPRGLWLLLLPFLIHLFPNIFLVMF